MDSNVAYSMQKSEIDDRTRDDLLTGNGESMRSSQSSLASSITSTSSLRQSLRQRSFAALKNKIGHRKPSQKELIKSKSQVGRRNELKKGSQIQKTIQTVWASYPACANPFGVVLSDRRRALQKKATNIDENTDIHHTPDYAFISMEYTRARENAFKVVPYLTNQADMKDGMRRILVDWMVEVQDNWQLGHETLYASVRLLDIFLSKTTNIPKGKLQLLGATSIFLCCKFHERYVPGVDELIEVCENEYARPDFTAMEKRIFEALDFDINMPVAYSFTRRFADIVAFDIKELTLARYVLELTLLDYDMITVPPSKLAAAAILWTLLYLGKNEWNISLEYHTSYEKKELIKSVFQINELVITVPMSEGSSCTVYEKYSSEAFFQVAKVHRRRLESVRNYTTAYSNALRPKTTKVHCDQGTSLRHRQEQSGRVIQRLEDKTTRTNFQQMDVG